MDADGAIIVIHSAIHIFVVICSFFCFLSFSFVFEIPEALPRMELDFLGGGVVVSAVTSTVALVLGVGAGEVAVTAGADTVDAGVGVEVGVGVGLWVGLVAGVEACGGVAELPAAAAAAA